MDPLPCVVNLFLVRHAESTSNSGGFVGGNSAVLTEQGREQAMLLAETWIRHERTFELAWSSTLHRAGETMRILLETLRCQTLSAKLQSDARLIERQHADWEGRRADEVYTADERQRMVDMGIDYATPGGESFRQVAERMFAWSEDVLRSGLALERSMVDVLAVSHGHAIRCLLWKLFSLPDAILHRIELDNTSVTHLSWTKARGWSLRGMNNVSHLLPLGLSPSLIRANCLDLFV